MQARTRADVLIVGAGIAGLSCARELARGGARPRLLERSRGPGGRCATRRLEGVPVDHGPGFLHGSDPSFLRALEEVDGATPLPGWPERTAGGGRPCQAAAFARGETRTAWREGVRAFPRDLARGLEVQPGCRVTALSAGAGGITATAEDGSAETAPWLVLALPAGQARPLLATLPAGRDRDAARELLDGAAEVPCLAVLAAYGREAPEPPWDILYPEESPILHLVSHEGSKRPDAPLLPLVFQARPCWSRQRLEQAPESWASDLLAEAGRLLGAWARAPRIVHPHRWRFARAVSGTTLSRPLVLAAGAGRVGLAGEMFAPGGGAEAAWRSGRALARRILGEESA